MARVDLMLSGRGRGWRYRGKEKIVKQEWKGGREEKE